MIRIVTFGGLRVSRDSDVDSSGPSSSSKRDALLAYLAVEASACPVSRDTLLALLWPEFDERRARNALNQLLYTLRSERGADLLESGRREIALNPRLIRCDAVELESAVAEGDHRRILELYRGDFLSGFHLPGAHTYEEWVAARRARYQQQAATSGKLHAASVGGSGDVDEAARIMLRVLDLNPFDESSVRDLMRLHLRSGDVGQALLTYEAYAARLREELDAGPSPETIALLETARGGGMGGGDTRLGAGSVSLSHGVETVTGARQGGTRAPHRDDASPPETPVSRPLAPKRIALVAVLLLVAAAIVATALDTPMAVGGDERLRVAVLPFENIGPTGEGHFATGLTDELIFRLARVQELEIVSAIDRGSDLPLPSPDSIGRAYDAPFVLLGSVRWLPDEGAPRVRVVPRLIRTRDRAETWSESYEAHLEDIFDLQSRIAGAVTRQLGATLVGEVTLSEPPTRNPEAYLFLLRGRDLLRREWVGANLRMASRMFEEAIGRDSALAEAWAGLSLASSELHMGGWERTDVMRRRATEAARKGLALDPESSEVHFAQAMVHYRLDREYRPALDWLERAEAARPGDSDLLLARAYLERRRGEWETALAYHRRALELEPRVARGRGGLVWTLIPMRRYTDAQEAVDEALELFPDMRGFHGTAAWLRMIQGDVDEARAILEAADRSIGYPPGPGDTWTTLELLARRYDVLLDLMAGAGPGAHLDRAVAHHLKGSLDEAWTYFDSARVVLEKAAASRPDDPWMRSRLALAYAGTGRYPDGLREAKRAVELLPVSRDAVDGPRLLERLALVLVLGGRHEEAIEVLGHLLEIPSEVSVPRLRIDPRYDALRGEPGFQRLLRRHGRS